MIKTLVQKLAEKPGYAIIGKQKDSDTIILIPVKQILYVRYYEHCGEVCIGMGHNVFAEFEGEEAEEIIRQLINLGE